MEEKIRKLRDISSIAELKTFLDQHKDELSDDGSLSEYLLSICEVHNLNRKDIIKDALIDTVYGYQIFEGRRTPKRNKMIQLAFGFPLSYEELQQCLYYCGANLLVPHVKVDAVIIYACTHGLKLSQLNDLLYDIGEEEFC